MGTTLVIGVLLVLALVALTPLVRHNTDGDDDGPIVMSMMAFGLDVDPLWTALAVGLFVLLALRKTGRYIRKHKDELTWAERHVLAGLLAGKTEKQIAKEQGLDFGTVQLHRQHIRRKLGLNPRLQMPSWYYEVYGDPAANLFINQAIDRAHDITYMPDDNDDLPSWAKGG